MYTAHTCTVAVPNPAVLSVSGHLKIYILIDRLHSQHFVFGSEEAWQSLWHLHYSLSGPYTWFSLSFSVCECFDTLWAYDLLHHTHIHTLCLCCSHGGELTWWPCLITPQQPQPCSPCSTPKSPRASSCSTHTRMFSCHVQHSWLFYGSKGMAEIGNVNIFSINKTKKAQSGVIFVFSVNRTLKASVGV